MSQYLTSIEVRVYESALQFVRARLKKSAARRARNACKCSEEEPRSFDPLSMGMIDDGTPPCWKCEDEEAFCAGCKERNRIHQQEVIPATKEAAVKLRKLIAATRKLK